MTEDMPRKLPLFVNRERSRHGRVMFFFRRGKGARVRLPDAFPSPEFDAAYHAALTGLKPKKSPLNRAPADRLEWLIGRFMESGRWAATAPATRRQRELLYLSALKNGNPRFASIARKHMQQAVDDRARTPALAKNYLKAMRALFKWAVKNDHLTANPCDDVEPVEYKSDGFPHGTPTTCACSASGGLSARRRALPWNCSSLPGCAVATCTRPAASTFAATSFQCGRPRPPLR